MKKVLLGIVVVLVIFLSFIGLQKPDYTISREIFVKATPETLFPFINNSQKSNEWMPWKDSDPQMKMTYSGPAEGAGAVSSWESKGQMGVGKAEVVESQPGLLVVTRLTYEKPMQMVQLAEISLTPKDGGTVVKWSVTGQNNFMGRLFCFFMNMDKMVGGEFEKGLTKLKAMTETPVL